MSEQNTSTAVYPQQENREEISFRILEHIGVLRASAAGWTRELNIISWCDRPARYDIRDWTPDHQKSSRGLTFTEYEMRRICEWMGKRRPYKSMAKEGPAPDDEL